MYMMFQVMYMMLVGRDITVLFSDPSVLFSEAYDWLMSKFASPSTPSNMDAVGWTWWLTALGIPRLFAMADDGMELLLTYAQDHFRPRRLRRATRALLNQSKSAITSPAYFYLLLLSTAQAHEGY